MEQGIMKKNEYDLFSQIENVLNCVECTLISRGPTLDVEMEQLCQHCLILPFNHFIQMAHYIRPSVLQFSLISSLFEANLRVPLRISSIFLGNLRDIH